MIFDYLFFFFEFFQSPGDIGYMCRAGIMLAISSGYKNDLVCALRTVSLTSFNFTARVGFITVLLSECVFVGKAGGGD